MAINIAPKSLDTDLSELMRDVASGKAQLPEFQRSWTWDDNRITGILASLSQGYPMGAIMRLTYGNENVRFKYRTIEGVSVQGVVPDYDNKFPPWAASFLLEAILISLSP